VRRLLFPLRGPLGPLGSVALLAVTAMLLAACDDDTSTVDAFAADASDTTAVASDTVGGDTTPSTEAGPTTTTAPPEPVVAAEDSDVLDAVTVTGDFGVSATVVVDGTVAVDETARRVLVEGDGPVLEEGAVATFQYAAVNGASGEEFETSFGTGLPPSVPLDATQIFAGIVRGMLGVAEGSRVLIAMAPDDAFGPQGGLPEAGVAAEDTVLFLVDVLSPRASGTPVEPVAGLPTVELDETGAPTITVPAGDPPTTLVAQPLIVGDGPVVESGNAITVQYTGIIYGTGVQFDSSWGGTPAQFQIGVGGVIAGWDQGLVGQTVGSQVLLVIPPDLGYGTAGQPSAGIAGTDTLVFVVDIVAAGIPPASATGG
jgi:peptidylprolyl isomerase